MLARHYLSIVAILLASGSLAGCCCPGLSCRYGDPGCPSLPLSHEASCGCGGCTGAHHSLLTHGPLVHGAVPTNQRADYVSPVAKFHPVPTHPVFEPQPDYLPPHALAGPVPRRDHFHPGY